MTRSDEAGLAMMTLASCCSVSPVISSGAGRYVVKTKPDTEVESVRGAERVADDLIVVGSPDGRPTKETWQRVVDEHDDAVWVQPVLVDDDGRERFPTGELTVRFDEPPTDEALRDFAHARHLQIERRTTHQPAQVVLVPEQPRDVYLPDLVADLEGEPGVTRAWANTLSRYTRA